MASSHFFVTMQVTEDQGREPFIYQGFERGNGLTLSHFQYLLARIPLSGTLSLFLCLETLRHSLYKNGTLNV